MGLLWWAVAAFLLTIGLAWVLLPLFGVALPWRADMAEDDARRLIKREKAKAMRRIKDLEHERDAGMIDERDYEHFRRGAMEEVVLFNRRLEDLTAAEDAYRPESDTASSGDESEVSS